MTGRLFLSIALLILIYHVTEFVGAVAYTKIKLGLARNAAVKDAKKIMNPIIQAVLKKQSQEAPGGEQEDPLKN